MHFLKTAERYCLYGHIVSMAFGLAGLLLVMPHPDFLKYFPAGQKLFQLSMAGGGVVYILLGTIAVGCYAYRTIGAKALLAFLIPSIGISLACELLGTSSGFPFGDYSYLNGLGYKIAGLVPFTIPLSWFYLGLSSYLLSRGGFCRPGQRFVGLQILGSIALGAVLLMAWDFVLDPAMSQTALPFWYWHEPGAFFGMPYQNFAGWFGTGVVFMSVATLLWRGNPKIDQLTRHDLVTPLVVYLANFAFAMVMSMAAGFWIPISLGFLVGAGPAILCWWRSKPAVSSAQATTNLVQSQSRVSPSVGVVTK